MLCCYQVVWHLCSIMNASRTLRQGSLPYLAFPLNSAPWHLPLITQSAQQDSFCEYNKGSRWMYMVTLWCESDRVPEPKCHGVRLCASYLGLRVRVLESQAPGYLLKGHPAVDYLWTTYPLPPSPLLPLFSLLSSSSVIENWPFAEGWLDRAFWRRLGKRSGLI